MLQLNQELVGGAYKWSIRAAIIPWGGGDY